MLLVPLQIFHYEKEIFKDVNKSDMQMLRDLIKDNQSFLIKKILHYAKFHNYVKYTSTLEEAWVASIAGLSKALLNAISINSQVPEMEVDHDFANNPMSSFGIIQAQKHRQRGVTLEMFLGLMKYYRQTYLDLIMESIQDREQRSLYILWVTRFFDHNEIAFCSEWTAQIKEKIISELQVTNRNLTNEKNKYLTIFESISNPAILLDNENHCVNVNYAAHQFFRENHQSPGYMYYSELPIQPQLKDFLPWLSDEFMDFYQGDALESSIEKDFELSNQEKRNYIIKFHRMLDVSDKFEGTIILLNDITERKKIEEQLRYAKERFSKAFNLNPNLMIITSIDNEATYIDVNDAFLQAIGLSRQEIVGRLFNELNLFADIKQHDEAKKLASEQGYISNYELLFRSGDTIRTGLLSADKIELGGMTCMLTVINDITEKKQLDKELARFDSLNLVGEIAASIGHEVRNPMTTVRGYLQMFQVKSEFSSHSESLKIMIEELDRANSIISEFLSLAKNKIIEMKPGNLNNILNVLFPLIQADAFRLGISIQIESNPLPDISFDEKEIRQLILNLVRNALEAIEQGGIVKIKTYSKFSEIILEVSDTGQGIPKDILDQIGTPFLTTKENGTGLGLAVCCRIAQHHKAKIDVKTDSTGTTFFIRFPSLQS